MEIERKFLVNSLPNLNNYQKYEISQGYISMEPTIRIRKKDDVYYLTKKGKGSLIREEIEEEISKEVFEILISLIQTRLIEKTRYKIPLENGQMAELDIYHKDLIGLSTVEVEFKTIKEAQSFIPPNWFGKDITEDNRFKNNNLAIEDISFLKEESFTRKRHIYK